MIKPQVIVNTCNVLVFVRYHIVSRLHVLVGVWYVKRLYVIWY